MKIKPVLDSGDVLRYHAATVDRKQNLAEHQWGVALILKHIYPEASVDLIMEALTHDAGEAYTGDIPSPVKKSNRALKAQLETCENLYKEDILDLPLLDFTMKDMLALKWADVLEGIYYCKKRVESGDKRAEVALARYIDYGYLLTYLNSTANDFLKELVE